MPNYTEKLQQVEAELAAVEHELSQTPAGPEQTPLRARRGSLERSAQWYRRRLPRKIESIGAAVSEEIRTAEAH